ADGRRRGRVVRSRWPRRGRARSDELRPLMTVITFLTDFGLEDDFVGTCHGVIAQIAPDVSVIDVTHGIGAQAVLSGGLVLRATTPYMPVGAPPPVVRPPRGGNRPAAPLAPPRGRLFAGPDIDPPTPPA